MVKCGKGCMPECEYFTTGGCISPFNCPYKIETGYINTATSVIGSYTQGKDDLNEPKIKKWFRSLVDEGKIQQEPMNYDAATLQIYIDHLEKENAALRERLEKAVELPVKIGDKVYMPWVYGGESGIAECEVYHIALFKDRNDRILIVTDLKSDNIDFKRKYNYGQFMLRDFGVKLFTAPEAALARLAELKGGKE